MTIISVDEDIEGSFLAIKKYKMKYGDKKLIVRLIRDVASHQGLVALVEMIDNYLFELEEKVIEIMQEIEVEGETE